MLVCGLAMHARRSVCGVAPSSRLLNDGAASVGMDVEAREGEGGEQVTCGQHSAALTSLNGVGESRADHDPIHECSSE